MLKMTKMNMFQNFKIFIITTYVLQLRINACDFKSPFVFNVPMYFLPKQRN